MPFYHWLNSDPKAERPTESIVVRDTCPECGSHRYKKTGHTRHGKQNHQSKACDRQFVATAENPIVAHEQRTLIARLLRKHRSRRRMPYWGSASRGSGTVWWNALRPARSLTRPAPRRCNRRGGVTPFGSVVFGGTEGNGNGVLIGLGHIVASEGKAGRVEMVEA
jgi:hypothetical protein